MDADCEGPKEPHGVTSGTGQFHDEVDEVYFRVPIAE